MSDEKVFTYEEAKELCKLAFDGGNKYGTESMRYNCNALVYDWEHWLMKHGHRFRPKQTVDDVLREFLGECETARALGYDDVPQEVVPKYAAKLRLAGDAEFEVIMHPELLRTVALLRAYYYNRRAGDAE